MLLGSALSLNQPKLCPSATWNSAGFLFGNSTVVGLAANSIFINTNNTVYVPNNANGRVRIWLEGNTTRLTTIISNSTNPISLFVTISGNIYLDSYYPNNQIQVWRLNVSKAVSSLPIEEQCDSIFIDTNESLYCSIHSYNKVIKRALNSSVNQSVIVAGTGCAGVSSDMLNYPCGLFVTINFDLYVADSNNNRIQLFPSGQRNAITRAGNDAVGTISLSYPRAVVLDADEYLFIVDSINNRIVRSGPDGLRCVVACTGSSGSASNKLNSPQGVAFDSFGNLFVLDSGNSRVERFNLLSNSCSK